MRGRTFFRIMIDNLFINNTLAKSISALVKFCNEQSLYGIKNLKFFQNLPLKKLEQPKKYNKRFIFSSETKPGAN